MEVAVTTSCPRLEYLPQVLGLLEAFSVDTCSIHLTSSQSATINVFSLRLFLAEWDWIKEMAQKWPGWWMGVGLRKGLVQMRWFSR